MFVFVLSHLHFVLMAVIILIYFFCKGVQFRDSFIFSLYNNGGRAPMLSLFSLVISSAFLAPVFLFKIIRYAVKHAPPWR